MIPYKIRKALELIAGYCAKHEICSTCPMAPFCAEHFRGMPMDWEVEGNNG